MATASDVGVDVCSICTEKFTLPKLLPCFHSFCFKCLQQYVVSATKNDQFPCPMCRYLVTLPELGVAAFQTNFYIEAREERRVHTGGECGVCEQQATHSCRECETLMCESCARCHQKLPATRSHVVINLDKSDDGKPFVSMETFCEIHKDEKMRFCCMPCEKVICRDCKLTDHEGHKTKNISEVVEEARVSLTKTKVELEKCKSKIDETLANLKSASNDASEKISDSTQAINQFADSLVEIINKARCKAIDKVTDLDTTHKKEYSDEQYTIEERKCFVQSLIDHTETILKEGMDCDVITTDGEMKHRLTDVKKYQPDISRFSCKMLDVSSTATLKPNLLNATRYAISNILTHALPISPPKNLVYLEVLEEKHYRSKIHSINITDDQSVLLVQGVLVQLCVFQRANLTPKWKIPVTLDELKRNGIHHVINKYNRENTETQIPVNYYTPVKKPFLYTDTNSTGDTCSVIREHNLVVVKSVNGMVQTLTFNPFAAVGQEFKPVDVCWGNSKQVYIVDSGTNTIVEYSLEEGFQKSYEIPRQISFLSAVAVDTEGKLWIGDQAGTIHVCEVVSLKKTLKSQRKTKIAKRKFCKK